MSATWETSLNFVWKHVLKKKDNTQSHTCTINHHINPYQQSFKQKCSKTLRISKTSRPFILRSNIAGKAHTTTLKSFLKLDKQRWFHVPTVLNLFI